MSLPTTTMVKRLFAIALCLVALNIYAAFAPTPVTADGTCTCQKCGLCSNGQRCTCFKQNGVCTGAEWADTPDCKCKDTCGGGN